jgi:hypothetical protein
VEFFFNKKHELKEKRIVLQTEDEALSLHCKYGEILHKQRDRLKVLELTDGYNSGGSEALEIKNSILLYKDRMQAASAALLSISTTTKVQEPDVQFTTHHHQHDLALSSLDEE